MTKSEIAFQLSVEKLAKTGQLYLWTFTYTDCIDIVETRNRWNRLLNLYRKAYPESCGLRVYEMHESHGLHVHLVTNSYIDVNQLRPITGKTGWGRIHVEKCDKETATYLAKYLSKRRPECFKGWRLWSGFGPWQWTKGTDVIKRSDFSRAYSMCKTAFRWEGNAEFGERMEDVQDWLVICYDIGISLRPKFGDKSIPRSSDMRKMLRAYRQYRKGDQRDWIKLRSNCR